MGDDAAPICSPAGGAPPPRTHIRVMSKQTTPASEPEPADAAAEAPKPARETGGPKEADPTRFGDWTVKGRCIDF